MSSDRRAREKPTTRRKTRHVALDLLIVNGLSNVTVEQVVDAADVPPMAFYRHLGIRGAVIVDMILTGSIGQMVHREATLAPVAGTPEETVDMVDSTLDDSTDWVDDFARRPRLVHDNPQFQGLLWQQATMWTMALETLLTGNRLGARARACVIVGVGVETCLV